jgi:transposase-like protein
MNTSISIGFHDKMIARANRRKLMEIINKYPPKEEKKTGRRPKFTLEYMNMIAEKVVEDGMTFRVAAKTFDVSQGSIAKWVKNFKKGHVPVNSRNDGVSKDTQVYNLEEKVKGLTTEIGSLYLENQLLKKALSHLQSKRKETSSVITSKNLDQYQKHVK